MAPAATEIATDAAAVLKKLRSARDNRLCFDCASANPTWASSKFGVYVCLDCSGRHRALGTHVTFVRSLFMDTWSKRDLKRMELGGNAAARDFLRAHGLRDGVPLDEKYTCRAAVAYKAHLERLVDGALEAEWGDGKKGFVDEMRTVASQFSPKSPTVPAPPVSPGFSVGEARGAMPLIPEKVALPANGQTVTTGTTSVVRKHVNGSVVGIGARQTSAARTGRKPGGLGAKRAAGSGPRPTRVVQAPAAAPADEASLAAE